MKMKILSVTLIVAIFFCATLPSCSDNSEKDSPSVTSSSSGSYDVIIRELEEKILELQQNQYISAAESEKQINDLEDQIAELKKNAASQTLASSTTTREDSVFIYTIEDGKAVIEGFTGKDRHIVIPSRIDGYDVVGISENAFEGYSVTSIIISEGVKYIDWFAFYNCPALASITLPESVTKIGHSAFDGASATFTIYCPSGSFAQKYAQSYGIAYVAI